MESRESSSPLVTRSVAAALRCSFNKGYSFTWLERLGLRVIGMLPTGVASRVIPFAQGRSGLDPNLAATMTTEALIQNRLADYRSLMGRFPGVVIGVAQGGATAHLARLIGGPFLPQAFVLTIKGGSPKGVAMEYFSLSRNIAQRITDRNPELISIQHYDPVHDGWLTRRVNHLRLKLISLPEAYRAFIRERVIPGGDVIYLDGGATWLRQQVGPRNYYQAGGWGAISADEFYYGSERVGTYAKKEGFSQSSWKLDNFAIESGPESEWGSEPGLCESLELFCKQEGYKFYPIHFNDPNQFSRLAFQAYQAYFLKEGIAPSGVVIEMFSQYDAGLVRAGNLLPVWLIFNTEDSLAFLKSMLPDIPRELPVFFSALSTFSMTPDLVPWSEWESALGGYQWNIAGARPAHYPADASALLDWWKPILAWQQKYGKMPAGRLSGKDLVAIATRLNNETSFS